MTTTHIVILLVLGVAIVAGVLVSRSGPRVTTIETRHEVDKDGE